MLKKLLLGNRIEMKLKQQNLKAFELTIDDEEQFRSYLSKNAPLMQGHLLVLTNSPTENLSTFLKEQNFCFVSTENCELNSRKRQTVKVQEEPKEENPQPEPTKSEEKVIAPLIEEKTILHRPVRSGETINAKGDIVVFGRINSGAILNISGNGEFFDIIDGTINCNGDYLILQSIGKGSVTFNSETINKEILKGSLNLVTYKNGIIIKEIA